MDANGVERAILLTQRRRRARPRPALRRRAARSLRPRRRRVQPAAPDEGAARRSSRSCATTRSPTATVGPSFWGDGMYPPSDAVYYPLYTKCCELDLPLCINTGIPGPPIPGEAQNPIHLDRVCVRFPELKLCMIHGADPWWDTAIRLMLKYRNLRLMTSAWSPKRLPESLLHYMRDARQGPDPLRLRLPGAVDGALPRRGGGARPARRGPRRLALRQRRRVLLRSGSGDRTTCRRPEDGGQRWTSGPSTPTTTTTRRSTRSPATSTRSSSAGACAPVQRRQAARAAADRRAGQPLRPEPDLRPDHRPRLPRPAVPRARSPRASTRAR